MEPRTDAWQEEQRRLEETLAEIERQLSAIGPAYYGNDAVEQLLDAKRAEDRHRLMLMRDEPYFGRLDFRENGQQAPVPLYIGKRGMDRRDTGEPYVIDWRAPVASLFYAFTGGEEPVSYEAPEGTIEGEVFRKRNVLIRSRELQRVTDSYVRGGDNLGLGDAFLLYRLGEKKDTRLRDIVSTIQAEQDRIIRAPRQQALVIQGAAGSGKTTVALHRLAYLLYRHRGHVRAERMIIFAPNRMFLDYISDVLPELGVGDVRQTTFAAWALELLGDGAALADAEADEARRFDPGNERRPSDERSPGRVKGSLDYRRWIDAELDRLERNFLPDKDFEPWAGCVLAAAEIRGWFDDEYRDYPLAARRERLAARMSRWLEMQAGETADPKVRKERIRTGRQRLQAYLRKLPEAGALIFYRKLFESGSKDRNGPVSAELAAGTLADLKRGVVRLEDLPALVRIHLRFHGAPKQPFDHVVVDEAQDASPFQIAVLRSCMREPSFTILGDLAQGIHAYRGIERWEELAAVFGPEPFAYHVLRQSYRSTYEIVAFANRILPHTGTGLPAAQPVFRSGEPVERIRVTEEEERLERAVSFIRDSMARGLRTVALICRTEEDGAQLHARLKRRGVDAHLITGGNAEYRGGVSVLPVHLSKGLEFDAVLLPDAEAALYTASPRDARLLYVGCTRALHKLAILYLESPSPLLPPDTV